MTIDGPDTGALPVTDLPVTDDVNGDMKMPAVLIPYLRCPGKPSVALERVGDSFTGEGGVSFPVINGTPILIDEANSVFEIADFAAADGAAGVTTMDLRDDAERLDTPVRRFKNTVLGLIPGKSRSVTDFDAEQALEVLLAANPDARILVIGAGDARFETDRDACVVYTDVALAPDTHLIADAHDIPFADGTFDALLSIAVLEHVADPWRCAEEIRRVLKPTGWVYAVTPFMQQVHMGRYDFTRFTAMGHRRLFRWFDEERSGVANGPGMAVAWSLEYMFSSMAEGRAMRSLLRTASRFVTWPFLLLDGWIGRKSGAYDCASAFYFFGQVRDAPIPDREIVKSYRGLN